RAHLFQTRAALPDQDEGLGLRPRVSRLGLLPWPSRRAATARQRAFTPGKHSLFYAWCNGALWFFLEFKRLAQRGASHWLFRYHEGGPMKTLGCLLALLGAACCLTASPSRADDKKDADPKKVVFLVKTDLTFDKKDVEALKDEKFTDLMTVKN